ncbi:hypothetical protein J4233_03200 [Candidatus Pacearchaeota archaeon]|nr:hypothetical protein [Candidatus Pacearchaeota archaeon]
MERGVSDRSVLDAFAEDFCKVAEKHVKYIVVSGYVAISHGRFRTTEDIDMIIEKISFDKFEAFHNALDKAGFHCMQSTKAKDIYEYLAAGDGIRYVRKETFLPPEMEIKFAKDELDEMQIKTRKKMPFTGLDIWFSSIEMNIAFKEELLKSPKDVEDARHLRRIYEDEINPELIEEIKEKIRILRLRNDKR